MLSEKILTVGKAITKWIYDSFPYDYLNLVFSGILDIDDCIDQVILECIKVAYDSTSEKHSLRYYLSKRGEYTDDNRMRYSRLIRISNEYKRKEIDRTKDQFGFSADKDYPPKMSNIDDKLDGYCLTEMNFYELTNIGELELIKSIVYHRLGSAKKVPNKRFREIAQQYDKFAISLMEQSKESDEKAVINTFAYFTLEWKYAFNFLYYLARSMERLGIGEPEFAFSIAAILMCRCSVMSILGFSASANSRMVGYRERLISNFFQDDSIAGQYQEMFALVALIKENAEINGISIQEWFIKNTNIHDWASFLREYDVFKFVRERKEYTNTSIRNMRNLICLAFPENPEKRSYTPQQEDDNLETENTKEVITMVKIDCYIEEYKNKDDKLCARLRDKTSNRKIVIVGDQLIKNHFLCFLSAAREHIDIMPTVYDRNGTDIVAVRGLIQSENTDFIEISLDAPGAGYLFQ